MGALTSPRGLAAGAVMLLCSLAPQIAVAAETPSQAEICDEATGQVDVERLAMAALGAAGVSAYPYRWVINNPTDYPGLTAAQHLLSTEGFCALEPGLKNGVPRCGPEDQKRLNNALNMVIGVLQEERLYRVPAGMTAPGHVFATGATPIACIRGAGDAFDKGPPTAIAAPFDQKEIPIRLRGSTDGLQFDRNRDTAFAGVEKAALSFKADDAAGKDTTKANVVVGFAIPAIENVLELVPYFGFVVDTSRKSGQARDVSDDTVRAGTLLDFRTHGDGISHLFLARPEFAANRKERSEVLSANLTYQPLVNGWLNDAYNVLTSDGRSLLSVIPRGEIRLNWGEFLKQGTRSDEDSRDFVRLGGQVGVTVTSDVKWLPVELSVTETYLRALRGAPGHLSQLRAIFSIYFDEKKFFGIDLGYARGRREDLVKREDNWTFAFGAKF